MDFEFSDDQELLRDSVRRFLADRAPLALRPRPLRRRRRSSTTSGAASATRRHGMLVPEAARRRGHGHGRPRARCSRRWAASVYPGPFAASAVGAASLLAALGDRTRSPPSGSPASPTGTAVGRRLATDTPARDRRRRGATATAGARRHEDPRARRRRPPTSLLVAVDADTRGRASPADDPSRHGHAARRPSTASRKFATVTLRRARPATELTGVGDALAAASDRLALAFVLDGVGAAERRARARGRVREGARAVRQADRLVPGRAAPVRRHAARRRARPGRGVLRGWACDEADAAERHRAVTMAQAFAADGFYRVGATAIQVFGGVGFTWEHDIHLFYKRLLTLQHLGGSASDQLEELATPRPAMSATRDRRDRGTPRARRSPARPGTRKRVWPYDSSVPTVTMIGGTASGQIRTRRRCSRTAPTEREQRRAGSTTTCRASVSQRGRPSLSLMNSMSRGPEQPPVATDARDAPPWRTACGGRR